MASAPRTAAFDIRVYPASEVYDGDLAYLHERCGIGGAAFKVEEFEDGDLESWLQTDLKAGGVETADSAWLGERASALSDSAEFKITAPGVRVFGVGLGDNDSGTEQLSINGGLPVELKRFLGHEQNGSGRAFYMVVIAEPNDPDISSIVVDQCRTASFDHVVALKEIRLPEPKELRPRLVLNLADGTRLVGEVDEKSVHVSVREEQVELAWERVFSMQFARGTGDSDRGSVILRNGEKLSVVPGFSVLNLRARDGLVSVSRENIRKLKVTARGEFRPEKDFRSERLKAVFHATEPEYGGKPLRGWLEMLQPRGGIENHTSDAMLEAEFRERKAGTEAIRAMAPQAVPFLLEMLSRGGTDGRSAVNGFAGLGELGKPALPELLLLLKESRDVIQWSSVIWSIGHLGPAGREAIPVLLGELRLSPYPTAPAEALGNIGPAAADAVPIIIEKISAGNLPYDLPLIVALGKLGSKEAVPALVGILKERLSERSASEHVSISQMRKREAFEALRKIAPNTAADLEKSMAALL